MARDHLLQLTLVNQISGEHLEQVAGHTANVRPAAAHSSLPYLMLALSICLSDSRGTGPPAPTMALLEWLPNFQNV